MRLGLVGYNKDMFFKGLAKIAVMTSAISPEHYYELETDKYPHAGANIGALAGGVVGAYMAPKGRKHEGAVKGALLGGGSGYVAGKASGKVVKQYKVGRLYRAADEMRLRSTPSRARTYEE